ncbi:MAG: aldo/keto reductase [Sphaerochaetaceae bacterium]|jgi:myo-inositol catabolism protein IolS
MNIALGSWALVEGFDHKQTRKDSLQTLHYALKRNIRHFDTAQGYSNGKSEQLIGHQMRRFRFTIPPKELTIATKIFLPHSPQKIRPLVETSLRRLLLSYIDILYIHWPDSSKEIAPYIEQLTLLQQQGLIRHLGVSNFPSQMVQEVLDLTRIDYIQLPVSLLWRRSLTHLLPLAQKHSIQLVAYSPLMMGLLGGKYRRKEDLASGDIRRSLFPFKGEYIQAYHALLDQIEDIANKSNKSMSDVALQWVASQSIDTLLLGSRTKEQLHSSLHALEGSLNLKEITLLNEASSLLDELISQSEDNPFFHHY